MLKQGNHKGFTIIEVVITIAIGAAVMALVLNAVAGARRSQRNNARVADVGAIATAVNNYYGSRNSLPADTADIDDPLIDRLAYYPDGAADIAGNFPQAAWTTGKTVGNGTFLVWTNNPVPAAANTSTQDATPTGTLGTDPDQLAIILQASCNDDFSAVQAGGIREMVITYKLEGQDGIICREI